ncbi:MAG: hypothetical protein JSS82_09845 [Bacteroidetes bacterium]|nr:hypothetical protein [Bacteroidota bacterium]
MNNDKPIPYNSAYKNAIIDIGSIKFLTGLTLEQWCEFSGIYGAKFLNNFLPKKLFKIDRELSKYPNLTIFAKNENLDVAITFKLDCKEIYTIGFFLPTHLQKKGYGEMALESQIAEAENAEFIRLTCWAYGGKDYDPTGYMKGYIAWGKLGFTMELPDHLTFLQQMAADADKQHIDCLQKLLRTKEGTEYWRLNGGSWHAEFNLTKKVSRKNYNLNKRLLKLHKLYRR